MSDFDQIYRNGPVVALVRNPSDPWQILSASDNWSRLGFNAFSGTFDLTSRIPEGDFDLVSRKLGAAIMQKRSTIQMRYRIMAESPATWVEDFCTLSYDSQGVLISATSLLWITSLPLEWHLLISGSEVWNALTSKLRHDMLNQLTAILGYLELSSDMIEDPMLQDFASKEQNAAEKIREKLIFSREYQKIGQTGFEWIALSPLLEEVAGETGCTRHGFTQNIPEIRIFADKMLKQAFSCVLENIPEHASSATSIVVSLEKTPAGPVLIIEDNGPGIAEEHKTRIFDISFGKGQGHGLFLAEKLFQIYGISISENGKQGLSTRFELRIPEEIVRIG